MNPLLRNTISLLLLCLSAWMLIKGYHRKVEVCVVGAEELAKELELPVPPFEDIQEWQLIVDSTFGGTVFRGGRLWSTYDRSQPVGKRACPT